MGNIILCLVLSISFTASAETILKTYRDPNGLEQVVKIRTEAVAWVAQNIQGEIPAEKKLGIDYYISQFYNRLLTIDAKRPLYDEIYASMKPGAVSFAPYFVKIGLKIVILENHASVTDFPEYAHWRGRTVEDVFGYQGDLRLMDDIDGEATRNTCLLKVHRVGLYPKGSVNTFFHEFAHLLHMTTLTKEEFFALEKLYLAAKARKLFLDSYAAQSVHEYFAQGVEAYVSETKTSWDQTNPYGRSSRADLKRIDIDLHEFIFKLIEVY